MHLKHASINPFTGSALYTGSSGERVNTVKHIYQMKCLSAYKSDLS